MSSSDRPAATELCHQTANRPRRRSTRVAHRRRPALDGRRHSVHVIWHVGAGVPRLRRHAAFAELRAAFRGGKDRFGFRLVHFKVHSRRIDMVCEADDARSLSRGMQGLGVRIARRLNRVACRRGKVFTERYSARQLTSAAEVRRVLLFVLRSDRRDRGPTAGKWLDLRTSAPYVKDWCLLGALRIVDDGPPLVARARTWLLGRGWQKEGRPPPALAAPS